MTFLKWTIERLRSFKPAFRGIFLCFSQEPNACIHIFATVAVVITGFLLKINSIEWVAICICIGMVYAAEIFNTAIERTMNFIHPDMHSAVKNIKDLAAGAVLITAITAVIVAAIIFIPKIIEIFP